MARTKKTASKTITTAQTTVKPKRTRRTKREMIRDGFAAFGLFPEIE